MAIAEQRRLAAPAYVAAFSLMIFPIFDQVMQLVPAARFHDARWRFGGLGLISNMLVVPVAGLLLAFATAAVFEHRGVQRVLAVLALVEGVFLIAIMGLFTLDAVQVRAMMRPEAHASWAVASATAMVKFGVATLALGFFAYAGLRNSRPLKIADRSSPLLMKRPKTAAAGRMAEFD